MIKELVLTDEIIGNVKTDVTNYVTERMKNDLVEVILYGSCARGDYTNDSDIDIALITRCDRLEAKKYGDALSDIATELAMKYFVVVNFVVLPYQEFVEKKVWYSFFRNIANEGQVLYG